MKLGAMVAVSSFALSQVAAGQAVQWKVSEGGNGHWYQVVSSAAIGNSWNNARALAESEGGHLATFSSASEWSFARDRLTMPDSAPPVTGIMFLGGSLQAGVWRWVDGTAWLSPTPWWNGIDCGGGVPSPQGDGQALQTFCGGTAWDDRGPEGGGALDKALVEWSADCNNDGIVDYGQCRDGSLPDYNGNNIPDCCEQGIACIVGRYPVQWRADEGGNGHWFQKISPPKPKTWPQARDICVVLGGHLATVPTASEAAFVHSLSGPSEVYLGGMQLPRGCEPGCNWRWITDEAWGFTNWSRSEPNNNSPNGQDFLRTYSDGKWDDVQGDSVFPFGIAVEWSADCNNDGIVDYGQILLGQLEDIDGNGVPNACEAYQVPGEFSTIQAAIDAVPAGQYGLVLVAAGTRNESFSLNGKNVRVQGAANNATILDGTGLAVSIARFTGGEPATAGLANLVFRYGTAGSRITPKGTFTVGGAVYGLNSAALITSCRFEQNEADFGGAVYLLRCDSAVETCVFAGNEALTDGGAFFAYECSGFVRSSDFTANSCGASGSGNGGAFKSVGAKVAGGTFLLQDCSVTGTISGVDGAAVDHFENSVLGVRGVLRIVDTDISANSTAIGGGGVRNDGPQHALVFAGTTTVCGNTPRNVGGAFLIEGSASVCDCLADLTGDGQVNGGDLGIVLSSWGSTGNSGLGDVTHDGIVNGQDLGVLLSYWGACGG